MTRIPTLDDVLRQLPIVCAPLAVLPDVKLIREQTLAGLDQALAQGEQLRPVLILVCPRPPELQHTPVEPEGTLMPYTQLILDCAPFMHNDERKNLLSTLGHCLCERLAACCAMFISEVWWVESHGQPIDCQPSDHPQKKEAVVFHLEYQPDVREHELYLIERDAQGHAHLGERVIQPEEVTYTGRLCNWLPDLQ